MTKEAWSGTDINILERCIYEAKRRMSGKHGMSSPTIALKEA